MLFKTVIFEIGYSRYAALRIFGIGFVGICLGNDRDLFIGEA